MDVMINQANVIRMMMALFIMALIFAVLFFSKNKGEPAKVLFKALCIGVFAFVAVFFFSYLLNLAASFYPFRDLNSFVLSVLRETILSIILVSTFVLGFLKCLNREKFSQLFDVIIYMIVILLGFLLFYNFSMLIILPFELSHIAALIINGATLTISVLVMSYYLTNYCFSKKPALAVRPLLISVVLVIVLQVFTKVFLNNQALINSANLILFYTLGLVLVTILVMLKFIFIKQMIQLDKLNNNFLKGKALPKETNLESRATYLKNKTDSKLDRLLLKQTLIALGVTLTLFILALTFFLIRICPADKYITMGTQRVPKMNIVNSSIREASRVTHARSQDFRATYVYEIENNEELVNRYLRTLTNKYNFYFTKHDSYYDYVLAKTINDVRNIVVKVARTESRVTIKYLDIPASVFGTIQGGTE